MPQGFSQSQSPQVQSYAQAPPQEQAEQMFKEGFTKSAYSVLHTRFPDVVPVVVTFKILESSAEDGNAVGAFIVMHENTPLYIPAIMVGGELKPMEMFYYKELNIFLPLTPQWLDEISKMNLEDMGEGADVPPDVPTDVDITKLVVPPATTVGRYGYASAEEEQEHGINVMFKAATDTSQDVGTDRFLGIVSEAPLVVLDGLKLAFHQHPALLQKLASNYGVKPLQDAFAAGYAKAEREKVAAVEEGFVKVATIDTSGEELKSLFGEGSGQAFSDITKSGMAIHDSRGGFEKIAVKVENEIRLDAPGTESGFYELYFLDGKIRNYFVVPYPVGVSSKWERGPYIHSSHFRHHRQPIPYLVVDVDTKEAWVADDVAGRKIFDDDSVTKSKVSTLLQGKGGSTPTVNSFGFFIHKTGDVIEATEPFTVGEVVKDDGRVKVRKRYGGCTMITDDDPTRKKIDKVGETGLIFLPKSSQWVTLVKNVDKDSSDPNCPCSPDFEHNRRISVINDPKLISRWMNAKLQEGGAPSVTVKKADSSSWWFPGVSTALTVEKALPKLAMEQKISVADAAGILRDAQENGTSFSFVMGPEDVQKVAQNLLKTAQGAAAMPPAQAQQPALPPAGGAPAQGGQPGAPADPAMMGQDPAMMGQPAAPQITPSELAIAEMTEQLQMQNQMQQQETQAQVDQLTQQMEMTQQANDMVAQVLMGIQQRTQEIANAGGAAGEGIPPEAMESPSAAAGMIAPQPSPEEVPPPMPFMEGDSAMSPESVADQINPDMVDMVEDFQGQDIFDTGAVSMLSSAPVLQEVVASYVPNLEKSLDNIGRILLTLWLQETEAKEQIGDEAYVSLEDQLRTVFKGLGDVILNINQNAVGSQQQELEQVEMGSGSQVQ
jgi:hypothetical protein